MEGPRGTGDARVGLAGPFWGLGAAVAAWLAWQATGNAYWGAIAQVGGWLNLFYLLPIWQLDGGRGFRSLTRAQRGLAVAAIGLCWFFTGEGLLVLLLIGGIFRCFGGDAARERDDQGLAEYVVLVAAHTALCTLHVPLPQ